MNMHEIVDSTSSTLMTRCSRSSPIYLQPFYFILASCASIIKGGPRKTQLATICSEPPTPRPLLYPARLDVDTPNVTPILLAPSTFFWLSIISISLVSLSVVIVMQRARHDTTRPDRDWTMTRASRAIFFSPFRFVGLASDLSTHSFVVRIVPF